MDRFRPPLRLYQSVLLEKLTRRQSAPATSIGCESIFSIVSHYDTSHYDTDKRRSLNLTKLCDIAFVTACGRVHPEKPADAAGVWPQPNIPTDGEVMLQKILSVVEETAIIGEIEDHYAIEPDSSDYTAQPDPMVLQLNQEPLEDSHVTTTGLERRSRKDPQKAAGLFAAAQQGSVSAVETITGRFTAQVRRSPRAMAAAALASAAAMAAAANTSNGITVLAHDESSESSSDPEDDAADSDAATEAASTAASAAGSSSSSSSRMSGKKRSMKPSFLHGGRGGSTASKSKR